MWYVCGHHIAADDDRSTLDGEEGLFEVIGADDEVDVVSDGGSGGNGDNCDKSLV